MAEEFSGIYLLIRRSKTISSNALEIAEITIDVHYHLNSNFFLCEYFISIRLVPDGRRCRNTIRLTFQCHCLTNP